jgi:hypothetical protein
VGCGGSDGNSGSTCNSDGTRDARRAVIAAGHAAFRFDAAGSESVCAELAERAVFTVLARSAIFIAIERATEHFAAAEFAGQCDAGRA